eukprot:6205659-Karenia_brevis.AAC.1
MNVKLIRQRLANFKVRKTCFRKLRRAVGGRRIDMVLRTGGTAALNYGQANTGVGCSTLMAQRRAVAAVSTGGGA